MRSEQNTRLRGWGTVVERERKRVQRMDRRAKGGQREAQTAHHLASMFLAFGDRGAARNYMRFAVDNGIEQTREPRHA